MTATHQAIAYKDLAKLRAALASHPEELTAVDGSNHVPLIAAVKSKEVLLVRAVLEAGADVNATSKDEGTEKGYTAAHIFARAGDVDGLALLVEFGADLDAPADDGWRPLHCASFAGKTLALRLLAEKGADPNVKNQFNLSPLVFAANHGRAADVRCLLQHGAVLEVADDNGDSILHHGLHYQMSHMFDGKYDLAAQQLDVATVLAVAGADPAALNTAGHAPTHYIQSKLPALPEVLRLVAANAAHLRGHAAEWNYLMLHKVKVDELMTAGVPVADAVALYEAAIALENQRQAEKKSTNARRGMPPMAAPAPEAAAAAPAAAGDDPHAGFTKEIPADGSDPSGGKCPFFVKRAKKQAVKDSLAAGGERERVTLDFDFVYENRTSVLLVVVAFFSGIMWEQRYGKH
jgi:ankyrin repeat protein